MGVCVTLLLCIAAAQTNIHFLWVAAGIFGIPTALAGLLLYIRNSGDEGSGKLDLARRDRGTPKRRDTWKS